MKKIKLFALTLLVSAMVGILTPVLSQDNPDARRSNTERYDDDRATNYSWIGLLGLLGLAGLYKKSRDERNVRDVVPSGQSRHSTEG
jgi:hypothetical protein